MKTFSPGFFTRKGGGITGRNPVKFDGLKNNLNEMQNRIPLEMDRTAIRFFPV